MPSSLKYRLKVLAHTGVLTKEDLSRIYTDNDVINELEKIKAEIQSIIDLADSRGEDSKLAYQCQIVINERISELKGGAE